MTATGEQDRATVAAYARGAAWAVLGDLDAPPVRVEAARTLDLIARGIDDGTLPEDYVDQARKMADALAAPAAATTAKPVSEGPRALRALVETFTEISFVGGFPRAEVVADVDAATIWLAEHSTYCQRETPRPYPIGTYATTADVMADLLRTIAARCEALLDQVGGYARLAGMPGELVHDERDVDQAAITSRGDRQRQLVLNTTAEVVRVAEKVNAHCLTLAEMVDGMHALLGHLSHRRLT
jgi:hypothetical protein